MRFLLETSAYSAFKQNHDNVVSLIRRCEEILFSTVIVGELLAGFRWGGRLEANLQKLREFLNHPWVSLLPVTFTTADRYGRIYGDLRRKGTPIPSNDIWVACSRHRDGSRTRGIGPPLWTHRGFGLD
ncbi:MAG: type II toxin-antitoxin system VapC family toxin [Acidobacteriota bacterium]